MDELIPSDIDIILIPVPTTPRWREDEGPPYDSDHGYGLSDAERNPGLAGQTYEQWREGY